MTKKIQKYKKKLTKNILTYGFNNKSDYQIIKPKYNVNTCKFELIIKNFSGKKNRYKKYSFKLNGKTQY